MGGSFFPVSYTHLGDILFFRIGDQPAQGGQDDLIVHLPFRGSVAVGQDADIGGEMCIRDSSLSIRRKKAGL